MGYVALITGAVQAIGTAAGSIAKTIGIKTAAESDRMAMRLEYGTRKTDAAIRSSKADPIMYIPIIAIVVMIIIIFYKKKK